MTVTPAKVRTLVEAKKPGAAILAKLKHEHHRTLITILIGNNFVNIAASALTTAYLTEMFDSAAVGIATGVLTFLILVFGEIVPKSLATTYAKKLSLLFAWPLYILGLILTPLIWLFDGLVRVLLYLLGSEKQSQVTDEELIAMASIGAEEGSIDEQERELIENVLEFNDIRVEDLMTPRVHMDTMPEDFDLDEATDYVVHHTHSRIPVYRDTTDNIVGILSVQDLLQHIHDNDDLDATTLRQVELQTPFRVAHSMRVQQLFHQFKNRKTHMAIVLDEHGGTAGLITMEDLLEELVGEIEDEADQEEAHITEIKPGLWEVSGRTELDELQDLMGLEFDFPEYKTVSYLIIEHLGQLPKKGQSLEIEGWHFKITKMYRHTILKVEVWKKV